jgi:hypothetical protein
MSGDEFSPGELAAAKVLNRIEDAAGAVAGFYRAVVAVAQQRAAGAAEAASTGTARVAAARARLRQPGKHDKPPGDGR